MAKVKLYLEYCYEAYTASEIGLSVSFEESKDTRYYKFQTRWTGEVELPKDYKVCKTEWGKAIFGPLGHASLLLDTSNDNVRIGIYDHYWHTLKEWTRKEMPIR